MSEVKVSVIIPVYNVEDYLAECLDSLLSQTLNEFEIICVDDGSTDNSLEILREYKNRDPRIHVIEQKNQGAGKARNVALEVATGQYLMFLDADDFFDCHMLEGCFTVMEIEDSDVVVFAANQYDVQTKSYRNMPWSLRKENCPAYSPFSPQDISEKLFNSFQNWPWNKMYRHSFIKENNLRFQEIARTNDMLFVCCALAFANKISIIDTPFANYRVGTGSSLQQTNDRAPLAFWDAYTETKRCLEEHGVYELYEQSYLNTVLSGSLTNLRLVKEEKSQIAIKDLLKNQAEDIFHFSEHSQDYYYYTKDYFEYLNILGREDIDPTITVLMPSLNVVSYIRQCVESVCNQTLYNLEILCIDAGSDDGTLEILQELADQDDRIRIIHSDRKSYGYQMNIGLREARGEYIGIVETDDFVDSKMYEELYKTAKQRNHTKTKDADVVKSNWYRYQSSPVEKQDFFERYKGCYYYNPLTLQQKTELVNGAAGIWSGIYKREFLLKNKIDFLETPGASYQDTAFILKVWMAAETVVLQRDAFLHYRIDNETSSVHSSGKAYFVCDEMDSAFEYMNEKPQVKELFSQTMWLRRADAYRWNYNRLDDELRLEFAQRVKEDFAKAYSENEYDIEEFTEQNQEFIKGILDNPEQYVEEHRSLQHECDAHTSNRPMLSVAVEGLNAQLTINTCFDSLLAQDIESYEILYIDKGSTDESLAIAEQYAADNDKIRILDNELKSAKATAVSAAAGEYILFVDARMCFEKDMFSRAIRMLLDENPDILFTKYSRYNIANMRLVGCPIGFDEEIFNSVDDFNAVNAKRTFCQVTDPEMLGKIYKKNFLESIDAQFGSDEEYKNDVVIAIKALYDAHKISVCNVARMYRMETPKYRDNRWVNIHVDQILTPWEKLFSDSKLTDVDVTRLSLRRVAAKYITKDFYLLTSAELQQKLISKMRASKILNEAGIYGYPEQFYLTGSDFCLMNVVLTDDPGEKRDKINKDASVVIPYRGDQQPEISVIIPVYNVEEYLEECIQSICDQTEKNLEIICVNDGSIDNSENIVKEFAEKDKRIVLVCQPNSGLSCARNVGVQISQGKYVYFIDSDDYLLKDALLTLKNKMDEENLDVLFFEGESFAHDEESEEDLKAFAGNYRRHFEHHEVKSGKEILPELWNSGDYWVSSCMQMVRKKHFVDNNLWFYPGVTYEDNAFTFKSLLVAKRVSCISDVFYMRRVRSDSIMTSKYKFKNTYGYFKAYTEMQDAMGKYPDDMDENFNLTANEIMYSMQLAAQNMFLRIDGVEQLKRFNLTTEELRKFMSDIQRPAVSIRDTRKANANVNSLRRQNNSLNNKLQQTYQEKSDRGTQIKDLKKQVKDNDKECAKLKKENEKLSKEIKKLKSSKDYKFGKKVLNPIRRIKKVIKPNKK